MIVPFSVSDFIDRAVQVYGDRVGVVDEPDQPAEPLGDKGRLTYREMAQLAARQAARLDELGIGEPHALWHCLESWQACGRSVDQRLSALAA